MKPHCVMFIRSDNTAMICAWCEKEAATEQSKQPGVTWANDNGKDVSHGICEKHAVDFRAEAKAETLPKVETVPFRSAGFLVRHNIQTTEDLEKFLNGEL